MTWAALHNQQCTPSHYTHFEACRFWELSRRHRFAGPISLHRSICPHYESRISSCPVRHGVSHTFSTVQSALRFCPQNSTWWAYTRAISHTIATTTRGKSWTVLSLMTATICSTGKIYKTIIVVDSKIKKRTNNTLFTPFHRLAIPPANGLLEEPFNTGWDFGEAWRINSKRFRRTNVIPKHFTRHLRVLDGDNKKNRLFSNLELVRMRPRPGSSTNFSFRVVLLRFTYSRV